MALELVVVTPEGEAFSEPVEQVVHVVALGVLGRDQRRRQRPCRRRRGVGGRLVPPGLREVRQERPGLVAGHLAAENRVNLP